MNLQSQEQWKKIKTYFSEFKTKDIGVQYAIDVFCFEKYVVSNYVKKACMRHLLFIYKSIHEKDFPFYYDSKKVMHAYVFFKLQIIPETRKSYILAPYRAFIISAVIGMRYKKNPEKIITQEIMDTEGRKNGKSTFYAIFNTYVASGFLGDFLPQVYICGAGEKSSKIVYSLTQNLIKFNPLISQEFEKNNQQLIRHNEGGTIHKLPFEKSALEGQNPSLVVLTEYHLHPDNRMQESARTAKNESRNNQIIVYDTTKGQHLNYPYFDLEKSFKKFLDEQIENPFELVDNWNIFLFCAELDVDLYNEWNKPEHWAKANPNIGVTLSLEALINEYKMLNTKMDLLDFKVKRIGMIVNQTSAYFEYNDIAENQKINKFIYEEYFVNSDKWKNLSCVLGLDLSNTNDTTALVSTYEIPQPDGENIWVIKHKGFIPAETASEKVRVDKVPYLKWADCGWVKLVQGNVVDFNVVSEEIAKICEESNVEKLAYDPWQFRFLKDKIIDTSTLSENDLVEVKQNSYLTPSIKEFERKLMLRKIYIIDDNEMLIDHILNVSMKPTKSIDNKFYPEKVQINSRVDGAIAMFTALYERANVDVDASSGKIYSISMGK